MKALPCHKVSVHALEEHAQYRYKVLSKIYGRLFKTKHMLKSVVMMYTWERTAMPPFGAALLNLCHTNSSSISVRIVSICHQREDSWAYYFWKYGFFADRYSIQRQR